MKTDQCIFKNKKSSLILAIYVDDGILIGRNMKEIETLITNLKKEFEIKVERNPKIFLEMEIKRIEKGLKLCQTSFKKQILSKFGMHEAKTVDTPAIKQDDVVKRVYWIQIFHIGKQ